MAQSVLKIGSVLAETVGQGEVDGCTPLGESAWQLLQLLQLSVEFFHLVGAPFLTF